MYSESSSEGYGNKINDVHVLILNYLPCLISHSPSLLQKSGWPVSRWTTRSWPMEYILTSDSTERRASKDTWCVCVCVCARTRTRVHHPTILHITTSIPNHSGRWLCLFSWFFTRRKVPWSCTIYMYMYTVTAFVSYSLPPSPLSVLWPQGMQTVSWQSGNGEPLG